MPDNIIPLDAYRAQRSGAPVAILADYRETPVPCSEVRLDDGRTGSFVTENINGDYIIVSDGVSQVIDPARVLSGDGPEAA